MRHVFPTSEVPHLWAHQTQEDARNNGGNLFFQGATIYSYRTSWPLARIYQRKVKGALFPKYNPACNLVLTNSERYSVTTARHQRDVNRAAQHLPCIVVPQCVIGGYSHTEKQDHAINMTYFAEQIAEHLAKAKRAMQVYTVNWRTARAQSRYQDAIDYSAFFGIRRKVAPFPAAEFDAARERAQRIETPDPVRDVAKIRARERKAAALEAKVTEYRAKLAAHQQYEAAAWRLGGNFSAPTWWHELSRPMKRAINGAPRYGYFGLPSVSVLLRVSRDQIESSRGARIPLEHAPRIWKLIQACRSTGRAYQANGHTEHAGPYAIDSVSAEGELRAGCHTIPYAELELLARTLGLPC